MASPISCMSLVYFLNVFVMLLYPCFTSQKYLHNVKVDTSLLASDVCTSNHFSKVYKQQGSTLEVVHKYGPCLELKNQEKKAPISQEEILQQDQIRVDSMQARFSKNRVKFKEKKVKVQLKPGTTMGTGGNYVVTLGVGTPKKDLTLVFDTGSDFSWIQCQPCLSCYKQSQPIFNPSNSSSYKNVSCSSSFCNLIDDAGGLSDCSSSTCIYEVVYGDGSYSSGNLATEKLTVSSSVVFNDFLFGCGQDNAGSIGRTAGLLALGPTNLSFPTQTAKKFNKIFSYCIPSSRTLTGYLSFGERPRWNTKFTPLSSDFLGSPYYGIDITGISVAGQVLNINSSVFTMSGAIIDSGTVITRLPPTAYGALKSTFKELMKGYKETDGASILDTCYDLSAHKMVTVPEIRIMFKGGAKLEIVGNGILVDVKGAKKMCLAFAPNFDDNDFAIIGNTQQKSHEVVHDLAKGRVGFAFYAC